MRIQIEQVRLNLDKEEDRKLAAGLKKIPVGLKNKTIKKVLRSYFDGQSDTSNNEGENKLASKAIGAGTKNKPVKKESSSGTNGEDNTSNNEGEK